MPRHHSIYLDGFAHANPIPAGCVIGGTLYSGVLTGLDPATGVLPPGMDAQCVNAFGHVRALLDAAGGTTDDIAKLTVRLADPTDRDALNREWLVMFPDADNRPARQVIAATLGGGALIHLDVVAVLA